MLINKKNYVDAEKNETSQDDERQISKKSH